MQKIDPQIVLFLSSLCRTYDSLTRMITATKNRLYHVGRENLFMMDILKQLESMKGKIERRIRKEIVFWPIWTQWMDHVPGIGGHFAANLILHYYYALIPICKKCGEDLMRKEKEGEEKKGSYVCSGCGAKAKADGVLIYRIREKDFPNIGKWWAYMGMHNDPATGKKVRAEKGKVANWSRRGRTLAYLIGDEFIRQGPENKYREAYETLRKKRNRTHPDATKMHQLNMARNEVGKLFLAHFWIVARTLDDNPVTMPYAMTILGHTGFIAPFYWTDESQETSEVEGQRASYHSGKSDVTGASQDALKSERGNVSQYGGEV